MCASAEALRPMAAIACSARGRQLLRLQHPCPSEDGIQGRPDLVRHHGEELILEMADRFGLLGQRLCTNRSDDQMLVGFAHLGHALDHARSGSRVTRFDRLRCFQAGSTLPSPRSAFAKPSNRSLWSPSALSASPTVNCQRLCNERAAPTQETTGNSSQTLVFRAPLGKIPAGVRETSRGSGRRPGHAAT